MKNTKKKDGIAFSILDFTLLVLLVALGFSAIFRSEIRAFLGTEPKVKAGFVFLIENVTDEAQNRPKVGEELFVKQNGSRLSFGTVEKIEERSSTYTDPQSESAVEISTLTCTAAVEAFDTEMGQMIGNVELKAGNQFEMETNSASFRVTILSVEIEK